MTSSRLRRVLEFCEIVEPTKGLQGHTARVAWQLSQALVLLDPDDNEASQLRDRAESIRKEMQGEHFKDFPAEDHSYDLLIVAYFR
jgi:capsule polysaccharide export protein KpsE/RkpR